MQSISLVVAITPSVKDPKGNNLAVAPLAFSGSSLKVFSAISYTHFINSSLILSRTFSHLFSSS